jgi:hypothetical protein
MDGHRHPFATYYPQVLNHIENDPTPKDQAVYIPSVMPSYAIAAYEQRWQRALPAGLSNNSLNFLDPANREFFHISHVMSSAGQALKQNRPCIITERDRSATTLICDSGGYQISQNSKRINAHRDRATILRWMELNADYAMTLDVPTGPVLKPGYAFASTADCLTQTLDHLDFFQRNRRSTELKLLNVLQGNNPDEADTWYESVKRYKFEGWAFAGLLRHNMFEVCRRIIVMADENQLQDKVWIHVLGTCELETAVLLTAVQRSINRHINPKLRISFDTSSPFLLLSTMQSYSIPILDTQRMSMPSRKVPDGAAYVGNPLPWPWPSPIGNLATLADFCVEKDVTASTNFDNVSRHLLAHHNLSALCWAIALANRVFDSELLEHEHTIARHVGSGVEAIDQVLKAGSEYVLRRYENTFSRLRHGKIYDGGEEQRPVP